MWMLKASKKGKCLKISYKIGTNDVIMTSSIKCNVDKMQAAGATEQQ